MMLLNPYPHLGLWLLWFSVVLASPVQLFFNIVESGGDNTVKDTELGSDEAGPLINKTTLDSWLADQYNVSWINLLKNIGNSSYTTDTDLYPGVVVASPSKVMPDYYYQWTRDSALTIRTLIHFLQDNEPSTPFYDEFQWLVEQYIWNNHKLQRLVTKSGDFVTGKTLGEPKFLVNDSQFDLNWGRPQSDGPGLRITSILSFLNLGLTSKTGLNSTFVFNEILKPDLLYVLNNWSADSFDLWEEINSLHFFTSMVQLKGLFDAQNFIYQGGADLDLDDEFLSALSSGIHNLRSFVQNYYINHKVNYVIESPKLFPKRSGLDAAVILGSIHTHDMLDADQDNFIPFNIDNSYILNHLVYLMNDMKLRYPVNHGVRGGLGVGIGRYPEDIYDGYGTTEGNPWFISTATASEMVLKLVFKLIKDQQDLIITDANKEFFQLVLNFNTEQDVTVITYNSEDFKDLIKKLWAFSDSFLVIVKDHVDARGGISEQFNKYHGFMQGARDLTWSYSSLLNAFRWRTKVAELISNF